MEVAVRDEQLLLGEDERVVGCCVELGRHGVVDVVEEVPRGAVHLRRAAERVGVLHLVAPAVRLDDRRAFEEAQHVGGRGTLPAQRAKRVDLRQERRPRALERLDRESARDVRGRREPPRPHEPEREGRRHELRAVDEGEPLLRRQPHGLETDPCERVRAGQPLAPTHASPSPTSGSARCARGARSPEAPTEPRLGTTGSTPRSRSPSSSSTVSTWAPELPFARAFARRSIAPRTISSGYGSPTPHAWERRSRSCSSSVCSSGMATATKRPKPVLTPYVCSRLPCAARSTRSRAARIFSRAPSESTAPVPSTATAHTSSTVRSSPVRPIAVRCATRRV